MKINVDSHKELWEDAAMKKKYTMNLDQESTEKLQEMLKDKGISFSSYVDSMIKEQITVMNMIGQPADVAKMTIGDLGGLLSRLVKGMKE